MSKEKENDSKSDTTGERTFSKPEEFKANRPAKRIIIPVKNEPITSYTQSTDMLIEDSKMIIAAELARYRHKAVRGIALDLKEARVVTSYIAELTKLAREEREASRQQDLSNLTDEELLQLAGQVLGVTKPKLIDEE